MNNTLKQLEKNIENSFSYVKKDMLALNDMVSDLNEKIQHLSINQATLLERMIQPENPKAKKEGKDELEFYDVKEKKKFKSSEYTIKTTNGRKFAVAKTPSGSKAYRILGSRKDKKIAKKTSTKPKKIIKETTVY